MLIPNVLMWAAALIASVWKVSQLARLPHDRQLRLVTACTVLVLVALSAQLAVSIPNISPIFPAQSPKLIQNVLLAMFFALLLVLLQSSVSPADSVRRGYIEVAVALTASGALIAIFLATEPSARGASYEQANGNALVLAFYSVGNLYMAYATARGAYLAWAASGHTQSRARLGLRVAAVGLMINCIGTHVPRVLYTYGELMFGVELLPNTEVWTTPILAIGIIIFFLGIGYPGVRTGFIKAKIWLEIRLRYHQLRTLWLAMCQQFPDIALFPPVHIVRELFHFRNLRLRYYRRIVECRDGLVCLSGYIETPIEPSASSAQQAELVRTILARLPEGRKRVPVTSVIAAPAGHGMEADTRELLALSKALASEPPAPAR